MEIFKGNNGKYSKTLEWFATESKAVGSMEHTVQKHIMARLYKACVLEELLMMHDKNQCRNQRQTAEI